MNYLKHIDLIHEYIKEFSTLMLEIPKMTEGDGLPMQGQDSATILSMFHDILEKETPFIVLMVTKGGERLPKAIKGILDEFKGMIPLELLKRLPQRGKKIIKSSRSWIGQVEAVRPLHGWAEGNNLLRQSLQPDLVPSSSPSPCTHIPRQSGGRCSLSEMNVASHVGLAPPTFPNFVIDVAVVSVAKDNHAQDRSS
ncbi:hypothetical protein CK203_082471 [Vitis vinifera]|uniref:Uncharacterized protein n=1 Tax=Vitis vinifera TaxID=29760 RepID=A0A438BNK0_VITVI|nr:hypothetical protein CK203_082471 [Vitis vinifera]